MSSPDIPPAANVLGTLGTVCWCIQLIPQVWMNWRTKSTEGQPGSMMFVWYICAVPFGAFSIIHSFNVALQIQPQLFGFFSLVCYIQTLLYHNHWKTWKAVVLMIGMLVFAAGAELALVFGLRIPYNRGVDWPVLLIGIIGAILLCLGLVPPYFELAKRNGRVIGISFLFLAVDFMGGVFSLFSLVAQKNFDILGGTEYSLYTAMEGGIFLSQIIWRIRTRKTHAAAKKAGMSYDDYVKADLTGEEITEGPKAVDETSKASKDLREDV